MLSVKRILLLNLILLYGLGISFSDYRSKRKITRALRRIECTQYCLYGWRFKIVVMESESELFTGDTSKDNNSPGIWSWPDVPVLIVLVLITMATFTPSSNLCLVTPIVGRRMCYSGTFGFVYGTLGKKDMCRTISGVMASLDVNKDIATV